MGKQITREAILHIPKSNFSYGYDKDTLHLRIRTKKGEIKKAELRIGDPYEWTRGGAEGGNMNALGTGWVGGATYPMKLETETELFDHWIAEFKPPSKRSRYAFILENDYEKILYTEKRVHVLGKENDEATLSRISDFYCFPYLNNIDVPKAPKWAKDIVWYQIFPDRFNNGDPSINPENCKPWGTKPTGSNFMGGDLQGVIDKLDYLEDLGVTGLYFCPIFEATTNHRYDTISYKNIDKALGDKETFKKLVDEAHKRGMKIMLDAVFNHLGYFSPQWLDVVENNEDSKYKDWFHIKRFPVVDRPYNKLDGRKLNYETFGRTPLMPKINTENEEVVEYLLDVAKYWSGEMNIDAWRLDVCNEVDHVFWRKFRQAVLEVNPETYILGEVWHDGLPWLMGDQFDSVMNYPLADAIREYFITEDIDSEQFKYMVNNVLISYPRQVMESTFNLLDSHDTSRILTVANGNVDKVKMALLFMFTQAGAPCIYYGTEVGMSGVQGMGSEMHRGCMIWNEKKQNKEMMNFIKDIINLRKSNNDFSGIDVQWLENGFKNNIMAYKKGSITIIINNNEVEKEIDLSQYVSNSCSDILYGNNYEGYETVKLKGYGYLVLK